MHCKRHSAGTEMYDQRSHRPTTRSLASLKQIRIGRGKPSPLGSSPLPDPTIVQSAERGNRKEGTMNPLIQSKTTPPLLISLALLCFGLLPRGQAVAFRLI